MKSYLNRLIAQQVAFCKRFDKRFFPDFSRDGNQYFNSILAKEIGESKTIVEIGGGKTPFFSPEEVHCRNLRVSVVDIDEEEVARAPDGSYERRFIGQIEQIRGNEEHDFAIAQSVLEHVKDGCRAAEGISSFVRSGGRVATFCPCRRAWFARLNMLLPEAIKRKILFSIFPEKELRQGFPAFYSGCTPDELVRNFRRVGVDVERVEYFFVSSYFMFFFPLYLLWRVCTWPLMKYWPSRYCETFMFVGVKSVEERSASSPCVR